MLQILKIFYDTLCMYTVYVLAFPIFQGLKITVYITCSLPQANLPFLPDLHTEVDRSRKKPYSAHIYQNMEGLCEQEYVKMPLPFATWSIFSSYRPPCTFLNTQGVSCTGIFLFLFCQQHFSLLFLLTACGFYSAGVKAHSSGLCVKCIWR